MNYKRTLPILAFCIIFFVGFKMFRFPGFYEALDAEAIRAQFKYEYAGKLKTDDNMVITHGQLTKDGLRFYVSAYDAKRDRNIIGVMKRKTRNDHFGKIEELDGQINNPRYNVTLATITQDENFIVFVNNRQYTHKTLKDLYLAERHPKTGKFDKIRYLSELNSESLSDNYPWISEDGLRIFFAKEINNECHWFWANRKSFDEKFKKFKHVQIMDPNMSKNSCLTLVNEEREIFALSGNKIYYSRRPGLWEYFPGLIHLTTLEEADEVKGFTVTDDKKELYVFSTDADGNAEVVKYVNNLNTGSEVSE